MGWRRAFGLVTLFCLTCSAPAAAWGPNGVPVCRAFGGQSNPVLVADGSGGAFIAWLDARNDASSYDVFLQRLTSDGMVASGWPNDGLAVATGPGDQGVGAIALDGAGGLLVPWLDTGQDVGDIYLQRLAASGAPALGWPAGGVGVAVSLGLQADVSIASDGAGGAFVAWDSLPPYGPGFGAAYLHHVAGSGASAPGWPPGGRKLSPNDVVSQTPAVLADGSGGVFAAWTYARAGENGLGTQHYSFSGEVAPGWPMEGLRLPVSVFGPLTGAASDGAGGLYATWFGERTPQSFDNNVYAQHITAAGAVAPGWPPDNFPLCTAPQDQWYAALCDDGAGGMYAAWEDYRTIYSAQVYAIRIGSNGQRVTGWPENGLLVSSLPGFQLGPRVVPDGLGGVYLAWMNYTGTYRVYAQHLTGSGVPAPGWPVDGFPLAPDTPGDQQDPNLVADGSGGAIVTWEDGRNRSSDIYAQKISPDTPVPVAISLASSEATPGRVRLRWVAAAGAGITATVYRREQPTGWTALGTVQADGTGSLVYEDHFVVAGQRYVYRLGVGDGASESFTAEVWVQVPEALTFALEGVRPNPTRGALQVNFSLPSSAPASLALIDIAGRRVAAREVGSLGAGSHRVSLSEGVWVPAGLYWVRLTQGNRTLTVKGLVVN